MAKPLVEEIFINYGEFILKQKVLYKHLPNAFFHCRRKWHVIKECALKVSTKQSPLQDGLKQAQEMCTKKKDTTSNDNKNKPASLGVQAGKPMISMKENNNDFTPLPKKKSFKQKKSLAIKAVANFYSLLDKLEFLDEDEELLETVQKTKLDGNRLATKLEKVDKSVGGDLRLHKVDNTPLNVDNGQKLDLTFNTEQGTEMERLKKVK